MSNPKYIFGPVPSRRLGRSLGISPIPKKTCNYSCIYCQLGRTNKMTNNRQEFFPLEEILAEAEVYLKNADSYDVVSLVGEGEPTLYSRLGELICGIKKLTDKPVAVITNGALLYDKKVREDLSFADIVLPSMDSYDEKSFRKIDRAWGLIHYDEVFEGLKKFTHEFKGKIFMEIMLMDKINDDKESILKFKEALSQLKYDRVYINTPVRPPAETIAKISSPESIENAVNVLGGISIDSLTTGSFSSEIEDDYEAILSIIGRHPMNQFEIKGFLESRNNSAPDSMIIKLLKDENVVPENYKGYITFRLK